MKHLHLVLIAFLLSVCHISVGQTKAWIQVVQDGKPMNVKEIKFDSEQRPVSFVIADDYINMAVPAVAKVSLARGKQSIAFTQLELTKAVTSFDFFSWAKQNNAKPNDWLVIELLGPEGTAKKLPSIIINVNFVK